MTESLRTIHVVDCVTKTLTDYRLRVIRRALCHLLTDFAHIPTEKQAIFDLAMSEKGESVVMSGLILFAWAKGKFRIEEEVVKAIAYHAQ